MKVIYTDKNQSIIRIVKGEELVTETLTFCEKEHISAAWIQALGAGDKVEISFYDLKTKTYLKKIIDEEVELLSLQGNIAFVDDKPYLHAHVSMAKKDYSSVGGHLHSFRVAGTGEVYITKLNATFTRSYDETTGLKLLDGK